MTGYVITAALIGGVLLLMAIAPSLWPRITPTTAPSADADPCAFIDDRIAAERDPARRAAWRMLRDHSQEDQ